MTFARFMALALYHPQWGYYERAQGQTGRAGDFYTSVSVGSLFGELLGFDLAERCLALEAEQPTLVEAGAHDGQLACDILGYLEEFRPALFERIRYVILEPSATRTAWQRDKFTRFSGKLDWRRDWAEVGSFEGVAFSNELLDAFPVHRWRWSRSERRWREMGIGVGDDRLTWVRLDNASGEAEALLPVIAEGLAEVLPDGFALETSPAALAWWRSAARSLRTGWLCAVDYGSAEEALLQPQRAEGTLRAYARHRLSADVLANPGGQDITAHVNFTRIIHAGELEGLRTEAFQAQGSFIKRIVERAHENPKHFPDWTPSRRRQLATLMHPDHFGRAFHSLVQERT